MITALPAYVNRKRFTTNFLFLFNKKTAAITKLLGGICLLFLLQSQGYAQALYWVGDGATNNWNDTDNWSNFSGGNGTLTATLPLAGTNVIFDGIDPNSRKNCVVNVNVITNSISIVTAYTGSIDINGATFNIVGSTDNLFQGGTINDGPGTSSVSVNSTGITRFSGTKFGANVAALSSRLLLNGSTFNGTATFTKSGTTVDYGTGGNTFNGVTQLINSGNAIFATGNASPDIFNNNLTLTNSGTSELIIATNSAGNQINGNLIINNASNLENASIVVASSSSSSLTVTGTTTATNSGSGANQTTYLGSFGSVTFGGLLSLRNIGTGINSIILLNTNAPSSNKYNENIQFECTNTVSTGIKFGQNGGVGTLANGKTMSIGPLGFPTGFLWFTSFIQTGATAQNLTLTGNADLAITPGTIFNGNVNFVSPKFRLNGGIYNGITTIFHKTGSTYDFCGGASVYNTNLEIKNSGTGTFDLANSTADDYNGNVTYTKTSTGAILASNNTACTYAGNIFINSNTAITLAANTNGRVILDGAGIQTINNTGTNPSIIFSKLIINKASGNVTLNTPVIAERLLTFTKGYIVSTAANLLTLRNTISVTGASNTSFVSGPVKKIGSESFTFPIGDMSSVTYAPLTISAPVSGEFTAAYFNNNPNTLYPVASKDASLDHLSTCEYWTLDRNLGSSSVNVSLSFDSPRSCGVNNLSDLRVARWNGTSWKDQGNGGTTGTTSNGNVQTATAISTFSPFTLGSSTANNPLPITLLSFSATLNNSQVDLKWSTSSETNNAFFTIQRSTDIQNWEDISTVKGIGNSNEVKDYLFSDNNPLNRISYYRLKQTDFDGQFTYSTIRSVNIERSENSPIEIYPNPIINQIIVVGNSSKLEDVSIYNMLGQNVTSYTQQIENNENQLVIDLTRLSSGFYYIKTKTTSSKVYKE